MHELNVRRCQRSPVDGVGRAECVHLVLKVVVMLRRYGRNGVRHARYREGPGTSCQGRMIQLGGGRVEPPHELKDRIRFPWWEHSVNVWSQSCSTVTVSLRDHRKIEFIFVKMYQYWFSKWWKYLVWNALLRLLFTIFHSLDISLCWFLLEVRSLGDVLIKRYACPITKQVLLKSKIDKKCRNVPATFLNKMPMNGKYDRIIWR